MSNNTELLFSYGTLQFQKVQLENYGRLLKGEPDKLFGYKIVQLKITDEAVLLKSEKEFHPIAKKSSDNNDFIEGCIFEISSRELIETDKYEVSDYIRILETFESGKKAWVYVAKNKLLG